MEQPVLDALYEASSRGKMYLGYVEMTDHSDFINTRPVTLWQPAPSTMEDAKAWSEAQEIPANYRLDGLGVMSFVLDPASIKTAHDKKWSPVRS